MKCPKCHQLLFLQEYCPCGWTMPAGPPPHELARNEDPDPSHMGAEDVQARVGRLQLEALEAVRSHPDCTVMEMATDLGVLDNRRIGRRIPEIREMGWIRRSGQRKCRITGKTAGTWREAEPVRAPE